MAPYPWCGCCPIPAAPISCGSIWPPWAAPSWGTGSMAGPTPVYPGPPSMPTNCLFSILSPARPSRYTPPCPRICWPVGKLPWRDACLPFHPMAAEGPSGPGGAAAFGGRGAFRRPGRQTKGSARGRRPRALPSGRFAPCRRPPGPLGPHHRQKAHNSRGPLSPGARSACRKTSGEWKIAALLGFNRIWRHKVNCPEGTREGPLGGVRQIRKKPCVARVSLHSSLAAP